MILENRIRLFVEIGKVLKNLSSSEVDEISLKATSHNNWFTPKNVSQALQGISRYLEEEKLKSWANQYNLEDEKLKNIGLVMAGNIPLAGFHDMLCILLSGNIMKAKLSSQDPVLPKYIAGIISELEPEMKSRMFFIEKLTDYDAVIATGSDNTARYFKHYFGKHPNIIRKNRNSVAILNGSETSEDFKKLGKDIFMYFGLGCRNISKIYVPEKYNFNNLFEALEEFSYVADHHKYNNNYDYNKSIFLVNNVKHLDNGFLLISESKSLVSPISVLHFEYYQNQDSLTEHLEGLKENIQCIVSKDAFFKESIDLGEAQKPEVWDYADKVDTMKFLLSL